MSVATVPAAHSSSSPLARAEHRHEGGLTLADLHEASEAIAQSEVVGLEIVELQNAWDDDGEPALPRYS